MCLQLSDIMAEMKKSRLLLTIIGVAPLIMAATYKPENMILVAYDEVTAKVVDVNVNGSSNLNHVEIYNEGDGYVAYDGSSDIALNINRRTVSSYGMLVDKFFINQVLGPKETAVYEYKDSEERSIGESLHVTTYRLGEEIGVRVTSYHVSLDENMYLYLNLDIYNNADNVNKIITVCEAEYDGKTYNFLLNANGLIARPSFVVDVNKFNVHNFHFFKSSYIEPHNQYDDEKAYEARQNLIRSIEIGAGITVLTLAVGCGIAAIVVPNAVRKKKALEDLKNKQQIHIL